MEQQMPYRLQRTDGGRMWFATIREARAARRQHGGRISMLMPGADPSSPFHWIAL